MSERKIVSRKVAVGLGAACIILAIGMVVALFSYLPTAGEIDSLNSQIQKKTRILQH